MENNEVKTRNILPYKIFSNPFNSFYVLTVNVDGNFIAAGDFDGNIFLYRNLEPTKYYQLHTKYVITIKISLNNKLIASGSADKTITLMKQSDEKEYNIITLKMHTAYIMKVDFSPNSQYLISASSDKQFYVYETATGNKINNLAFPQGISFTQFLSNSRIAIGGSHILLALVHFPRLHKKIKHFPEYFKQLSFSTIPQSSHLFLCNTHVQQKVMLKNCVSLKLIRKFCQQNRKSSMSLCIKHELALITQDYCIEVWNWVYGNLQCMIDTCTSLGSSELSDDGRYLVTISRQLIKVWQLEQLN